MTCFPKFAAEIDDRRERGPFPSSFLFIDYGFADKGIGTKGWGLDSPTTGIFPCKYKYQSRD